MAGWSREKRVAVEKAFYQYLNRCFIFSKDATGLVCLGENLYQGQRDTITAIFDALEADIHNIYILKSRQLGISTLIRALIAFLLGVHHGLKGAIVFDTSQNKDESRAELTTMIQELPASLKFPKIIGDNRAGLTLANQSKILFMSAGVRKNKASGTLGRSVGLSIAHCSELCSWDNPDGFEAFKNSLSDSNPDRLYIYESTARGFNDWNKLWMDAREDPLHCRCIFLGWWSKQSQRIDRTSPDFDIYGSQPPTEREIKKMREVEEQYGFQIVAEQLAWIRRHSDPTVKEEFGEIKEYEPEKERLQEQPWTESDAFQQTGSKFFAAENLTDMSNKYGSDKYKRYHYRPGSDFSETKVYQGLSAKETELKVWEEPDTEAFYVMGIDPAYGENEHNDRSAIQICRCYADSIEQVAEYASPLITTRQLAWVIASLLGWYGGGNNEIRYILELNGPGGAVWNELQMLKYKIDNDRSARRDLEERGLKRIFQNVKTYIYTRNDSMGAGYNYHFVTTTRLKVSLLERLRDFVSNGTMRVRSLATIMEMNTVARNGDSIGAEGSAKDDRVLSLGFAAHCWESKVQKFLLANNKTRSAEVAKKRNSVVDQVNLFQQNQLQMFFARKKVARINEHRMLQHNSWRYR